MIDKSITSLSDVEINALEQIMKESNFYNSITVAESPFSNIAVFDDNDVMQVKPFAEVDITYGEENVNVVLSRSSQEKCWFIKIIDNENVYNGIVHYNNIINVNNRKAFMVLNKNCGDNFDEIDATLAYSNFAIIGM
jgi:hypothetical protein